MRSLGLTLASRAAFCDPDATRKLPSGSKVSSPLHCDENVCMERGEEFRCEDGADQGVEGGGGADGYEAPF